MCKLSFKISFHRCGGGGGPIYLYIHIHIYIYIYIYKKPEEVNINEKKKTRKKAGECASFIKPKRGSHTINCAPKREIVTQLIVCMKISNN